MRMMRGAAGVLVLAVLAVVAVAAQPTPSGPYFTIRPFDGRIACGASAVGVSTEDRCAAVDPNTKQRFDVPFQTNLTGALIELAWAPSSTLGSALRIELQAPIDEGSTLAWEGTSPGRLWLVPITASTRSAPGTLSLIVEPPKQSLDPAVYDGQSFRLVVSLLYGDAALPRGFSGLADNVATPRPTPAHPAAPAHGGPLVATERSPLDASVLWMPSIGGLGLVALCVPRARRAVAAAASWALFSRLDEDRVLHHPRRAAILAVVRAQPGVGLEEARGRLAISRGAFSHHVRILEARRLVRRVAADGQMLLYLADARKPTAWAPVGPAAQVLEAIRQEPGLRQVDLAQRLGLPERTVRHHVLWLARRGRLRLAVDGRAVRCFPVKVDSTAPPRAL